MRVKFVLTNLMLNERTDCELVIDEKVTIGRYIGSPLTLKGDRLSRNHFSLAIKEGALVVEDLSSNGTSLNGLQMREKVPTKVESGDTIEIPGYLIEVTIESESALQRTLTSDPQPLSNETPTSPWTRAISSVSQVMEFREIALLLLAITSVALIALFLNS